MSSNGVLRHEERIEEYARSSEHLAEVKKGLERIAQYIEKGIKLEGMDELDQIIRDLLKESILYMIRSGRHDLLYLRKLSKGTIENRDMKLYSKFNSLILELEAERDDHMSYGKRIKNYFKDRITRVIRSGSFDDDYADWQFRRGFVNTIKIFIDKVKG